MGAEFLQEKLQLMIVSRYEFQAMILEDLIVWLELLKLVTDADLIIAIWCLLSRLDVAYSCRQTIDTEITREK